MLPENGSASIDDSNIETDGGPSTFGKLAPLPSASPSELTFAGNRFLNQTDQKGMLHYENYLFDQSFGRMRYPTHARTLCCRYVRHEIPSGKFCTRQELTWA